MASYLSKVANFNLPHLHLAPPLGVTSFEFCRDLWHQKTTDTGLSCGVWHCLRDPTLSPFSRTQTCNRQTDRHDHGIYHAIWHRIAWQKLEHFLQVWCHYCHQTNNVKALKETQNTDKIQKKIVHWTS